MKNWKWTWVDIVDIGLRWLNWSSQVDRSTTPGHASMAWEADEADGCEAGDVVVVVREQAWQMASSIQFSSRWLVKRQTWSPCDTFGCKGIRNFKSVSFGVRFSAAVPQCRSAAVPQCRRIIRSSCGRRRRYSAMHQRPWGFAEANIWRFAAPCLPWKADLYYSVELSLSEALTGFRPITDAAIEQSKETVTKWLWS